VMVWGLHLIDLAIVVFFLIAILCVGVWVSRGVKHEGDFYLGGRKLGRVLQFFLNFGNSTDSTGAVSTSTEVYRQGAGGMWIGFQTLFITPFFWFTQPWYRRSRLVTMADLFIDRFDSKPLASAYAAFNILIALITLGMGNLAAYKVCSAMIVKAPAAYTAAEKQTVSDFEEYRRLRAQRIAGTMPQSSNDRFRLLDDLNAHRKLRSSITYIREIPFYIGYSAIVGVYIALGGLRAAAITDSVQGVLVLAMSVLLIPLGLHAVGGFKGLHAAVPAHKFYMFGEATVSEYTWYSILAITFASLVQIIGLMHNMSTGGSARDEDTARFGMITGGFTKRFVLIMWMFCGLLALAKFTGPGGPGLSDPDEAWGKLSSDLLVPGLMGIMLSGMLLGHMPSVGVSAVAVSALATRNLYEPLVPGKSQKHYLRFGQLTIAIVLALGILCATAFSGVIQAATMMITFNTYFGAAVFLTFFWRRLTAAAIGIGLILWLVFMGIVPWFAPRSEAFRQHPSLLRTSEDPIPRAIFFDAIGHKDTDPAQPLEGIGRFNVEAFALNALGIPVQRFTAAGLLATRWFFDGLFPFVTLIALSLVTPRSASHRADPFYAKLKTPVAPTPDADRSEVEKSYADPHRFDYEKLFPGTNWEFTKWTAKDFAGFFGCWAVVGFILIFLYAVLHVGS
jgi:solute:Na+ symporter, SSS family